MEFVENLGEKDKESLADNGLVLIKSDSAGFFAQISSQNHGAFFLTQWVSANKIDYPCTFIVLRKDLAIN